MPRCRAQRIQEAWGCHTCAHTARLGRNRGGASMHTHTCSVLYTLCTAMCPRLDTAHFTKHRAPTADNARLHSSHNIYKYTPLIKRTETMLLGFCLHPASICDPTHVPAAIFLTALSTVTTTGPFFSCSTRRLLRSATAASCARLCASRCDSCSRSAAVTAGLRAEWTHGCAMCMVVCSELQRSMHACMGWGVCVAVHGARTGMGRDVKELWHWGMCSACACSVQLGSSQ